MKITVFDPEEPFHVLASSRRVVRLGENVFREGRLSPEAMDLACEVLAVMAGEYRRLDVLAVRAVGTSALRDATNRAEFLARATQILETPVEVISGLSPDDQVIMNPADSLTSGTAVRVVPRNESTPNK